MPSTFLLTKICASSPSILKKGLSDKEAAYASLIEGMDKSLGDLMNWLEKNDEADNTVIIFMSDNGG